MWWKIFIGIFVICAVLHYLRKGLFRISGDEADAEEKLAREIEEQRRKAGSAMANKIR